MSDAFRQAALAWAARGLRVFPLLPGIKIPYRNSAWTEEASSNAEDVMRMWTDAESGKPQNHNIGVLCNDMIVIDVDTKRGKQGMRSLLDLDLPLGTLIVKTPSGGQHIYYTGPNVGLSIEKLGEGLDIRSYNGYVLAPGSFLDREQPSNDGIGGTYELVQDLPIIEAPQILVDKLNRVTERSSNSMTPLTDLDRPEAIAIAAHYLDRMAPPAVQGSNGDQATFKLAAYLKDIGLTNTTAFTMMWERWNDRCSPPWDFEELQRKVENAYAYSKLPPGARSPAVEFGEAYVPTDVSLYDVPETKRSKLAPAIRFKPYADPNDLPRRPWIMHGLLCRRIVSVLSAPGSSGKTGLTIALAAHVSEGKDFAGYHVNEKTKVLLLNCEEDRDELEIRMHGACHHFGFDHNQVASNVALVPSGDYDWRIADGRAVIREHEINDLADVCMNNDIGLIIVDPLRKTHHSEESDNQAMDVIMSAFARLARRANIAVLLCHHTGKRQDKRTLAGDADASRGGSAIIDAARIAVTLVNAQEDDAEDFGIPEKELELYARLDDAKTNMARKSTKPRWFKKTSHLLSNGDETFAMVPFEGKIDRKGKAKELAQVIYESMTGLNMASTTAYHAAQLVIANDPVYSQMKGQPKTIAQNLKGQLHRLLAKPGVNVTDGDRLLRVVYEIERDGENKLQHMVVIK